MILNSRLFYCCFSQNPVCFLVKYIGFAAHLLQNLTQPTSFYVKERERKGKVYG